MFLFPLREFLSGKIANERSLLLLSRLETFGPDFPLKCESKSFPLTFFLYFRNVQRPF